MTANVTVEFCTATQSLDALQAAAYRLIGIATVQIDKQADHFVCLLSPVGEGSKKPPHDPEALKTQFLNLVSDENLRERIANRTEGMRNVILALAFGSLASRPDDHH